MEYKWTNLQTSRSDISEFNTHHSQLFDTNDIYWAKHYGTESLLETAASLIFQWNRTHPTIWKYELLNNENE